MKKNFIISIAALLIASASVFAAPNPAGDFQYDLNGEGTGVVIQEYLGSRKDVEIPAVIEGFPVVAIGDWAFGQGKLRWTTGTLSSVVIPDSVTTIGGSAFSENFHMSKVTLPAGQEKCRNQNTAKVYRKISLRARRTGRNFE